VLGNIDQEVASVQNEPGTAWPTAERPDPNPPQPDPTPQPIPEPVPPTPTPIPAPPPPPDQPPIPQARFAS
jgi:hypothetical protein